MESNYEAECLYKHIKACLTARLGALEEDSYIFENDEYIKGRMDAFESALADLEQAREITKKY